MKKISICFICVFLLVGCVNKYAYELQHKDDPVVDPMNLTGVTIISHDKNIYIQNVIDIIFDNETNYISYVRNDSGKFVKGKIKYSDVNIFVNKGQLIYDTENYGWYYVENGKLYDIYQDKYLPIEVE